MRTSTCLALIIACFALAPLSQAASEAPSFKKLDKDRDGFVSSDESNAAPVVLQTFSQLDRNTDGKLSKEEYAALEAAMSSGAGSSSPGASPAPPSSAAPPPSSATPPPSMDSGSSGGMARPPSP